MDLQTVWFALIAVLWIGYFVLDGFDLGVGMLLPVIGKDDLRRRVMINSIATVWDGNEVWLLVAGGATFAAFPLWYATMFSGYYLALFLVLLGLIMRGVAFEYRGKRDSATWRKRWDWAIVVGSALPALLFGVAFGNVVGGSPIEPVAGHPARPRRQHQLHRQPVQPAQPVLAADGPDDADRLHGARRDLPVAQDVG